MHYIKNIFHWLLSKVDIKTFWSVIFMLCILLGITGFGVENGSNSIGENIENIRKLLLSIAALIGIPFLVWRSEISDRAQKTADKTYKASQKSFFNDRYIKAVEQLSDEKETVRIAGTYALIQLLDEADKPSKDAILNVLWCFMEEHSSEDFIPKSCYSQFQIILPILPKKDNHEWWNFRSLNTVFIQGINLSNLCLSDLDFSGVNLSGANLRKTKLENCNFNKTTFKHTKIIGAFFYKSEFFDTKFENITSMHNTDFVCSNLTDVKFINCNLTNADFDGALLNGVEFHNTNMEFNQSLNKYTTTFIDVKYNNTIFPNGFDPEEHGMINIDEEKI